MVGVQLNTIKGEGKSSDTEKTPDRTPSLTHTEHITVETTRMPFSSRNKLFQRFNIFFQHKWKKRIENGK